MNLALHRYVTPLPALRRVPSQPGNPRSEPHRRSHEHIPRREPCRKTGRKPLLPHPDGSRRSSSLLSCSLRGHWRRIVGRSRLVLVQARGVLFLLRERPAIDSNPSLPNLIQSDRGRSHPGDGCRILPTIKSLLSDHVRIENDTIASATLMAKRGSNNGCRNGRTQLLDPTPAVTKPPAGGSACTVESRMLATRPSGSSTVGAWLKNPNARSMSSLRAAQWGQSAK